MSYPLLNKLLFLLPPETAHAVGLGAINVSGKLGLSRLFWPPARSAPTRVLGLDFPNPVGVAAGLDKNGDYIDGLAALGFGFIEIGTTTPRPQPGNPGPRLFRLTRQGAIINRMGFNNKGVDYLVERVRGSRFGGILGINIGKNFDTPVEQALGDYLTCMRKVYAHASYITVNISSPNTPGLRDLQFGDSLQTLLAGIKQEQARLADACGRYKAVVVKVAPDMSGDDAALLAAALLEHQIDGVIATNTTISRAGVEDSPFAQEAGGLSGLPLQDQSTRTVAILARELGGEIPIIGVGGIADAASARAKFAAGASLVQVYTGFIYRGPGLVGDIIEGLPVSS